MTLEQYIALFDNIATLHKGIRTFIQGSPERIIGAQRGNLDYPLMYLETPTVQLGYSQGAESASVMFKGAFSIMKHTQRGDEAAEDAALYECHNIAIDIIARLLREAAEEEAGTLFNFYPESTNAEPLSMFMVDNDYGYRCAFTIEADIDLCFDASKWDDGTVIPTIINKVLNRSGSYEQVVSGSVLLPDIIVTAPDGTTFEFPSCENIDTRDIDGWPSSGTSSFTVLVKYQNGTLISTNTVTADTELLVPNPRPADQYTVIVQTESGDTIATQEVSTDNAIIEVPDYPAALSGYAGRVLGLPQQVVQLNAGDCAWAMAQGAFTRPIPYGAIGFHTLDATDPLGATLNQNNRFGNKRRFTNLTGSGDVTQTVDILGSDDVTRTGIAFIDHLQNVTCFYVAATGTWAQQCARANGATCDGMSVYFASVDIATQLYVYSSGILSHIQRLGITIPTSGCYLGEAVAGTTNAYGVLSSGAIAATFSAAGARSCLLFKTDLL